jgi:site-specific recombinase XerD
MRLPKRDQRLPCVLSEKEVEDLIGEQRPKDNDRAGWRDRALVETLYSCGLRETDFWLLNQWRTKRALQVIITPT